MAFHEMRVHKQKHEGRHALRCTGHIHVRAALADIYPDSFCVHEWGVLLWSHSSGMCSMCSHLTRILGGAAGAPAGRGREGPFRLQHSLHRPHPDRGTGAWPGQAGAR